MSESHSAIAYEVNMKQVGLQNTTPDCIGIGLVHIIGLLREFQAAASRQASTPE